VPKPKTTEFKVSQLFGSVFVPSALFSTGEYALIPIIPASAERLGADLPTAGIIAGLVMVGTLLADLPAARFVDALGERRAMMWSALAAMAAIFGAFMAGNIFVLGFAVLLVGAAAAVFALARHAYMAEHVPLSHRARALSLLGGTFRAGAFIGPLLSSAVIALFGISTVFAVCMLVWLAAGASLWFTKDDKVSAAESTPLGYTFQIVKRERKKLLTVGISATVIGMLRTTRQIGLPLWALFIHMSPEKTALAIGIAGIVDFALFYTSGQIMDKFGRRAAAVPTLIGLSVTHMLIFGATTETLFFAIAIAMSLANGLGSGLILTLGADLAPTDARNEFLAGFRLLVDAGVAVAPPMLAGLAATVGLAAGMATFGVLGLGAAALVWRFIPVFIQHEKG
jgi:MFS family permease